MKKTVIPEFNESWAEVELWRWQYGELPKPDDIRELDVSKGLEGMANAIEKGDIANFPSPFNVMSVLRYTSRLITRYNKQVEKNNETNKI